MTALGRAEEKTDDDYVLARAKPPSSRGRARFFRRTYTHLAAAVAAFALLESWLLRQPFVPGLVETMAGSALCWLAVLGLFVTVALVA